ncbi:MAG: hypothetical protein OEW00_10170, partial [candidate division Zixibacteria bacterium]|nr:hypothetical protein [candidate division Zixibacteria bacterium]
GFTPAQGFEEFTIGSEHCLVDGVQLPEELATKIRNIFARYRGIELQEKEEVTYNLEKDRENPQIKRKITH